MAVESLSGVELAQFVQDDVPAVPASRPAAVSPTLTVVHRVDATVRFWLIIVMLVIAFVLGVAFG